MDQVKRSGRIALDRRSIPNGSKKPEKCLQPNYLSGHGGNSPMVRLSALFVA